MPYDAGRMGRDLDKSVCNGSDSSDAGYYRSPMVACATLSYQLDKFKYALYSFGNRCADPWQFRFAVVGEDTE